MDTGMDIGASAMTALQNQPLATVGKFGSEADMDKAAKQFESVFISQFLGSMFSGIKTDETFGGGQGEDMFRSLMVDQYAKSITQRGGFGLASAIQAQMMKMDGAGAEAAATKS